ncbi:glycosyltransferase family A protein [soil metagenome]
MDAAPDFCNTASATISCIVPVFNGERYLADALESIFAQTLQPTEVIVVDDGSTDGTAKVIEQFGGRLTYHRQPNAGPSAARNAGLDSCSGDFVAFQDADDLWHSEKLARQIACFAARPELEMCISHLENFWEAGREDEERRLRAQNHPFASPHPGFNCQVLLARRCVFDRVGNFDTSLRQGEDTDWYARAEEQGIVRQILPDVLVYRRLHSGNLTLSCTKEDRLKIVMARLQRHRSSKTGVRE